MTIEQLEQGKELIENLDKLESTIKDLDNPSYKRFKISGVTSNDNAYFIDIIPDDLMDSIRKYYLDKYADLKSEFDKL